jgi:hypothetical protein
MVLVNIGILISSNNVFSENVLAEISKRRNPLADLWLESILGNLSLLLRKYHYSGLV